MTTPARPVAKTSMRKVGFAPATGPGGAGPRRPVASDGPLLGSGPVGSTAVQVRLPAREAGAHQNGSTSHTTTRAARAFTRTVKERVLGVVRAALTATAAGRAEECAGAATTRLAARAEQARQAVALSTG
ncbi:MAG TPA: hypothetical protein VGF25_07210 [Thermoleophilaceae bacterium]